MCALVTGVQTCALPISGLAADLCIGLGIVELGIAPVGSEFGHHVVGPAMCDAAVDDRVTHAVGRIGLVVREGVGELDQIGGASCRERVCPYVSTSGVAVKLHKNTTIYRRI